MKSPNAGKMRIGDVAKQLDVKEFVIRFWEREFKIKARRSAGGQRFYTKQQVEFWEQIKDLLYTKEFTIAGAKKHLEQLKKSPRKKDDAHQGEGITMLAAKLDVSNQSPSAPEHEASFVSDEVVLERLAHVKQQLLKLKELL